MADTLTLDAPRRTADGYMAVRAKAARTGVYQYAGTEVDPANEHGLRDKAVVNILRDEATVFDAKAAHSFIGKPITDDHPTESVNARNWKDHARGTVMGAKWEEGGYLAFDLLLTDASAIAKVDAGSYVDLVSECTNVSVGYQHEHGPRETLDVAHLFKLREALLTLDASVLPVERDKTKTEWDDDRWGGYAGYGGGSNYESSWAKKDREISEMQEMIKNWP